MEREYTKDFHTNETVLRFQYRVPSQRCAGCGVQTVNYDARYGWHVCSDCDSDDVAADVAREGSASGF